MSRLAVAAAVSAALLACSRPRPSPEYERARAHWTALVEARGDDAAEDPAADEIIALLARVPAGSADAPVASELRARIEDERKARADERERRARLVAAAGAPRAATVALAGGTTPGDAADAAVAREAALAAGEKLEAFKEKRGDCFEPRGPLSVTPLDGGAPRAGEAWAMKDDPRCRARHPDAVGQLVLFTNGELTGTAPEGSARRVVTTERVTLGKLPDGGVGIQTDAGVVPLPPGATLRPLDGGDAAEGGKP
jgi:hypothetical protein